MPQQYTTTKSLLEEQLKRGEDVRGMWPWRLLLFSALLFVALGFIYLGMIWGYSPSLEVQIRNLDNIIAGLDKQANSDEPKALINLYSQLVNIKTLLKSHPMPSKIFGFLEGNTDPGVYYTGLIFSASDAALRITGVASDFAVLSRQLELFRRRPEVKTLLLTNSKTNDTGSVQFTASLTISEELFR